MMARRWAWIAAWAVAAPIAAVVAFGLFNLAMTATLFVREHQGERFAVDARRLALSGVRRDLAGADRRFEKLYSDRIGRRPEPAAIRHYLEGELAKGGPLVIDQALFDYIHSRWGGLDGRTLPPGVYVGARAIGPDTPPLSPLTKYLAHYAFFPRHGYVLVVQPTAGVAPTEFSASRASDFVDGAPDPHVLMIKPEPFRVGAYDFPGPGQAVHELYPLSTDPGAIGDTLPELTALAGQLRATGSRYELFRQNSNTVLGCMLRASKLHRESFERLRRDWLLNKRLLGIGRSLWSHPRRRPADVRCR